MKLVFTEQALISLEETLDFISPNVSSELLDELSETISSWSFQNCISGR